MTNTTTAPGIEEPAAILYDVTDRVATITLNRPRQRNAMNIALLDEMKVAFIQAEADENVDVVILTGTDPSFCAGLDLKVMASAGPELIRHAIEDVALKIESLSKPLIAAVNGAAVTGGFELALNCDFIVASDKATFGDSHARIGVQPPWGLTVRLPEAIGIRRAREMSFTGTYMGAQEALEFHLVNHVVPHDELLAFTRQIAAEIVASDQRGVRRIRKTYGKIYAEEQNLAFEREVAYEWLEGMFSGATIADRHQDVAKRGSAQQ